MLTVEQVKNHSELLLWINQPFDQDYSKCGARLCYLHNNRLSKLKIICPVTSMIINSEYTTEEIISLCIKWHRFTDWINKHDDLMESNLLTSRQYLDYLALHRHDPIGRNGALDLVENRVRDYNKIILV